jgi:hypothetical protein
LYELNTRFRLGADLFFSVVLIAAVGWLRFHRSTQDDVAWHQRQSKYTWMAVGVIFLGGILLVRFLDLMWLDFVPLMMALLLHPYAEKVLDRNLKKRKT